MNGPIVQLLQGMIHDSEKNIREVQDFVQSLPAYSPLRHTLRNIQHSELLRVQMLQAAVIEAGGPAEGYPSNISSRSA
jgi:hypothetical protein